jgi:hypothetical protein
MKYVVRGVVVLLFFTLVSNVYNPFSRCPQETHNGHLILRLVFIHLLVDMVTDGRIVNGHAHLDLWVSIASEFFTMIGTTYTEK